MALERPVGKRQIDMHLPAGVIVTLDPKSAAQLSGQLAVLVAEIAVEMATELDRWVNAG